MAEVIIGSGVHQFAWNDSWAKGAQHRDGCSSAWAHHGIVVTSSGQVITPHQERPEMLILGRDGELMASWPMDIVCAHGLTLSKEGGREVLWVADIGQTRIQQPDGSYPKIGAQSPLRGAVVKFSLDGRELLRLPMPMGEHYFGRDYSPTQVAVDDLDLGGSGEVWVGDGYGQNVVHRFDRGGRYLSSIDGSTGAGHFHQPHAVYIERRVGTPELFVADRGNHRIQVFDLEGRFLRSFGEDYLLSPSSFVAWGAHLIVVELDGRLTVVDGEGRLVKYLGESRGARARAGWPNAELDQRIVAPDLSAGLFNSPHGAAVDADLNLYVTEWLVGGRLVKLDHFGGS